MFASLRFTGEALFGLLAVGFVFAFGRDESVRLLLFLLQGTGIKANGKPARRPQMKEGISWLYENVEYDYACEIVRLNAERYLGVERLLE